MTERKKFYEDIHAEVSEAIREIVDEHPELDGAAITLVYAPELRDTPACIVLTDLSDPGLLCRVGAQVAKLQAMVAQGISRHMSQAEEAFNRIKQGTHDRQTEGAPSSEEEADTGAGVVIPDGAADAPQD